MRFAERLFVPRARRFAAVLAVAALPLVVAVPARAEPARYELDPAHTSVGFLVSHVGYAGVLGFFRDVEGSFEFDEAAGALSDLTVAVRTDSVYTNHEDRDEHLTGGDFLDTPSHPVMTFTAAGARRTGDRTFAIDGELTLLGRSAPLTLMATWNKSGEYPFGNAYVIGVSARGTLARSDFGMTYGVADGTVGDEVEIIVELEARRQR
jgi:polyisoprenoid-binding protein YceI